MEELYNKVISSAFDGNMDTEALEDYRQAKKDLLLLLYQEPIHTTDSKHFAEVRNKLQHLTLNGDPFLPEHHENSPDLNKALDLFKDLLEPDITFDEVGELASEQFYSWFSGEDYVINKIKGQLLFLQTERLPEHFKSFVREVQECYIFEQFIAAFALCRTITDLAINDLFDSNNLKSRNSEYWNDIQPFYEEKENKIKDFTIEKFVPTLHQRMVVMSLVPKFQPFEDDMHQVRSLGNSIVHGNRVANRATCTEMIKKTFFLIHHLYEVN